MLETLIARLGLKAGLNLSRAFVALALLALAALGFWRGIATIKGMVSEARTAAIMERDAHWTAEIEKSNAETALRQLQDQHIAQQRSAVAEAEITGLKATLSELEKSNVALPNGARCGLGRDRVRLLNR